MYKFIVFIANLVVMLAICFGAFVLVGAYGEGFIGCYASFESLKEWQFWVGLIGLAGFCTYCETLGK